MLTLLVVDDDPLTLDCFRFLFPKGKVNILTAMSVSAGLELFAQHGPEVVILDVHLPDLSGLEAVNRLHDIDPKVPIILITGHGTSETAIEAMRLGAYEYVVKPLDPVLLRTLIGRAFEISRLMRVPALLGETGFASEGSDMLLGSCPAMQEVYKAIGRVASQDVTVLILGESGTGKELVARAIYHYSNRARKPFLAINCAAIPETLLESELFGHEKGSFTGADRKRIGKFEQCHGGTLFLDEIGDMTPLTQTKILRVLQNKQFERVGGNELLETDVRIIAATNQELEKQVALGKFRHDLYYRLNVFTIKLPPLRERGEDLPLLAEHFLKTSSRELGKEMHLIAPDTLSRLRSYQWPGNVRELQSVVKQAIIHATGPVLVPAFLPESLQEASKVEAFPGAAAEIDFPDLARFIRQHLEEGAASLHEKFLAATERQLCLQVLAFTDNNLTQAARLLGISRATLRNKLTTLGITIERLTALEKDEPT